jgi:putative peptidoglycan lipid II flippase
LQYRAIALSTSVTMILNFMLLATVLYRKIDGYPAGSLFVSLVKIFFASGIMGLLVWWVQVRITGSPGIWLSTVKVFLSMSLGIISYGILAYILKLTEFIDIINKIINKIRN